MANDGAGGSNQRNANSPMRKPPIWASQATVASVTPSGAGIAPNRKLARNQKSPRAPWRAGKASPPTGPRTSERSRMSLGKLVDKRTFRIMYLARIASRSFTFDCFGLGFRATCFDGDLHGTFHRIFEGHLDSEQSVLVGRFGFVRFHRPT